MVISPSYHFHNAVKLSSSRFPILIDGLSSLLTFRLLIISQCCLHFIKSITHFPFDKMLIIDVNHFFHYLFFISSRKIAFRWLPKFVRLFSRCQPNLATVFFLSPQYLSCILVAHLLAHKKTGIKPVKSVFTVLLSVTIMHRVFLCSLSCASFR